jgi:hypothetical protein
MTILTPDSSAFSRLSYDRNSQQLTVRFRDRTSYQYHGVPEHIFTSLSSAPSQGRYFNLEIRNRYSATPMDTSDLPHSL